MKSKYLNIILAVSLVVMAAAGRVMNAEFQFYNFSVMTALSLFCGAVIKDKKLAFLLPLAAMFGSDLYMQLFTTTTGFYGIEQLFTYGALMLVTLLGTRVGRPKALKLLGFSLAGSLVFFIVSNFGVWMAIEFGRVDMFGYGKGVSGLINTYLAALPFYKSEMATQLFKNSVVGDLMFTGLLFGAYYLLQKAMVGKMTRVKA